VLTETSYTKIVLIVALIAYFDQSFSDSLL